jgi:hypothetical protein
MKNKDCEKGPKSVITFKDVILWINKTESDVTLKRLLSVVEGRLVAVEFASDFDWDSV